MHVQLCISNSFFPSSQSIKSDCSRSSVAIVPSDQGPGPRPLQDQILASLENESDEQLSRKSLKTSVNERRSGGADAVSGPIANRRYNVEDNVVTKCCRQLLTLRSMSGLLYIFWVVCVHSLPCSHAHLHALKKIAVG